MQKYAALSKLKGGSFLMFNDNNNLIAYLLYFYPILQSTLLNTFLLPTILGLAISQGQLSLEFWDWRLAKASSPWNFKLT
jgi:hypothetical protein